MSTEMKSFLTTLELLTKDKIDPETVLEEGELEETLSLDEDGELLSELNQPTRWRWNPHVNPDSEGWEGRDAEQDEKGMDEFHADAARQRVRDRVASNMRDDGDSGSKMPIGDEWPEPLEAAGVIPHPMPQAKVQDFHPRHRPPSSRNYKTYSHSDIELKPDGSDWRPTDPKVGSYMDEPGAKSTWDKLAGVPDWYLRSLEDAGQSIWRGAKDTANTIGKLPIDAAKTIGRHMYDEYKGVKDYGKRIGKDFRQNVLNSMTIEDANILLEAWEIFKQEELNDIRKLSGLKEATPGSMGTAYGDNLWRVEEVAGVGFQAYIWDDDEWVEVGEPGVDYTTHEEAEIFAKNAKYETDRYASKTKYMK